MAERDRQSIGTSRPLDQFNITHRATGQVGDASWFGPLDPMRPLAPESVKGRVLDYPSGYNLNTRPRAYESITFDMLRAFADNYDMLRILIETRKDQMARLNWNVVPRDKKLRQKGVTVTPELQNRSQTVLDFFLRPDKENFWGDWLRMLLEDLFVIDAPTIYRRKTYGDELYALQPIDGGTIKRVIDEWGNSPMSPAPAYQQVLKGYPAVDYTTEELLYRPRVKRTHKVYGYSPVEQIVMTINIGMRRQIWQLQSFTEGNVPEALIGTPDNWTPDQVAQFQDWFDGMLVNNSAERRRARFVPGGVAKGYVATKPDKIVDPEAEEWLIRVMCFAFNISPQPFVKMMNRATAETAQETAVAEGLAPIQDWVKSLMDTILIEDFDSPDLEFVWEDENELDPDIKSQIIDREHAAGRLTYNESRREQGLDPYNHPDADRPMFQTVAGWAPIFLTPEEEAEKEAAAAAMKEALGQGGPEEDGEDDDDPTDTPPGPGTGSDIPSGDEEGIEKADKSGEVADDSALPLGKPHPPGCGCDLAKAGTVSTSNTLPEVYADPFRPVVAEHEKNLGAKLAETLAALGLSTMVQVREALEPQLMMVVKNDLPDDVDIDALLMQLDLGVLALDEEELVEALAGVAADSGRLSLSQMGALIDDPVIVDRVNDRALNWAKARAADLVSFDDGVDPMLAQSTRRMLRSTIARGIEDNIGMPKIAEAIRSNYAFSEERAHLIAATEITSANSEGSLESYKEAAIVGVPVKKEWLPLGDACPICLGNRDAGAIPLDQDFPSGDSSPGAHPRCRCVLIPAVDDEPFNPFEKADFAKLDNQNDMRRYFTVDESARGEYWTMGGGNDKATAERESSLIQFVPFDRCTATQSFCDHDKVRLYMDDPTLKGFLPMAYFDGTEYYIQDGHHRAVASKVCGNTGMTMSVKSLDII